MPTQEEIDRWFHGDLPPRGKNPADGPQEIDGDEPAVRFPESEEDRLNAAMPRLWLMIVSGVLIVAVFAA